MTLLCVTQTSDYTMCVIFFEHLTKLVSWYSLYQPHLYMIPVMPRAQPFCTYHRSGSVCISSQAVLLSLCRCLRAQPSHITA